MKRLRFLLIYAILMVLAVFLYCQFDSKFNTLETLTFDKRTQLTTDDGLFNKIYEAASSDIVIINLDDIDYFELGKLSYSSFGNFPLKRSNWAKIINFIEKASPKVLLVDLIFEGYDDNTLGINSKDFAFANTLGQYDNIILSTNLTTIPEIDSTGNFLSVSDNKTLPVDKSLNILNVNSKTDKNKAYLQHSQIPDIIVKNAKIAANNMVIDNDGKVRFFKPVYKYIEGSKTYYIPSVTFAAALMYQDFNGEILQHDGKISFNTSILPVNEYGNVPISWHGKHFSYPIIPLSSLIQAIDNNSNIIKYGDKEFPIRLFKDKIVILSQTTGNSNYSNTALANSVTNSEINATIIDNILSDANYGNYIRRKPIKFLPKYINILISLFLSVIILFAGLKIRRSFVYSLFTLCVIIGFIYFSVIVFAHPDLRLYIPIIQPCYFSLCTFILLMSYKLNNKHNKYNKINNLYANFVSKKTLNKIMNTKNLQLEKSKKENVTVMICDIKDFNIYYDKYDSQNLMQKINKLFNFITEEIYKYYGTVDKFVEDSVVAYWGAPILTKDDELNAVKCAMSIRERLDKNPIFLDDETKIDIKISIHTDNAIIACVQTDNIEKYSLMGNCINIANQIDKICSMTEKSVLMSETTYNAVKLQIHSIYKGEVKLPYSTKKLKLYEPVAQINK